MDTCVVTSGGAVTKDNKRTNSTNSAKMRADGRMRTQSSSAAPGSGRGLDKDHYRVVVMGAAAVGKTCIISRFMYEEFVSKYKATVEELHRAEYELNGAEFTLDVLDTAGSYQFPAMRKLSISTGDAFILVYSLDDHDSFEEVKNLRQQIIDQKKDGLTPIVIVGNKSDLDTEKRAISREEAETTVNIDWGNGYVEASAKDNININGIFKELLAQANVRISQQSPSRKPKRRESMGSFGLSKNKEVKRNNCVVS